MYAATMCSSSITVVIQLFNFVFGSKLKSNNSLLHHSLSDPRMQKQPRTHAHYTHHTHHTHTTHT